MIARTEQDVPRKQWVRVQEGNERSVFIDNVSRQGGCDYAAEYAV